MAIAEYFGAHTVSLLGLDWIFSYSFTLTISSLGEQEYPAETSHLLKLVEVEAPTSTKQCKKKL